ncbi:MAG: sigma-70 family RNA polymerase sigma factor [Planctomycetia bacterium]|nr:sigma-70 family RNA polymerase sigma factor [Planctomycetia bacterium]
MSESDKSRAQAWERQEALDASTPEEETIDPSLFERLADRAGSLSSEERDQLANQLIERMFELYRVRLLRMIEVRLAPELRARVEANDVLQESFVEAYRQLRNGVSIPKSSPLVWLRLIVSQQLVALFRHYCMTQKRAVSRERSIDKATADPTATSIFLVGTLTSPSVAARKHELQVKIREALEKLSATDREIISLRHFEQLSNRETAEELNVTPNAASVMYARALKKFRKVLQEEKLDELLE